MTPSPPEARQIDKLVLLCPSLRGMASLVLQARARTDAAVVELRELQEALAKVTAERETYKRWLKEALAAFSEEPG